RRFSAFLLFCRLVVRDIRGSQISLIFSRNLALVSVLYVSERPEMTSHDGKPRKAKTRKGNYNHECTDSVQKNINSATSDRTSIRRDRVAHGRARGRGD